MSADDPPNDPSDDCGTRARPGLERGRQRPAGESGRVVSAPGRGLPPRPLRAEPGRAPRADRGDPRRPDALRGAPYLRGRRGPASPDSGSGPVTGVRERDHEQPATVRRRHHRLGGREPLPGLDEPGAPRPSGDHRSRHAGRARGADQCASDRTRRSQGGVEHLPHRRRGRLCGTRVRAGEVVRGRCGTRGRQRADSRAPRAPRADRLADRSLQPSFLPRAAARRADARIAIARLGRRPDVRPR